MKTNSSSQSIKKKNPKPGETHRIYWQQWITSSKNHESPEQRLSRRELVTSSAAVRISELAKASDVTPVLRRQAGIISDHPNNSENQESSNRTKQQHDEVAVDDSLVLVGTLYSLPSNYVQFEHEIDSPTSDPENTHREQQLSLTSLTPTNSLSSTTPNAAGSQAPSISSSYTSSWRQGDPFHIVKTVAPDENPLQAKKKLEQYLEIYLEKAQKMVETAKTPSGSEKTNTHTPIISAKNRTIIAPKVQWYYVPSTSTPKVTGGSIIPNCVELDGYCTALEEDDEEENGDDACTMKSDSDSVNSRDSGEKNEDFLVVNTVEERYQNILRSKFSWMNPETEHDMGTFDETKKFQRLQQQSLREAYLAEQLRSAQSRSSDNNISGYLLKRDMKEPLSWHTVYCVITEQHIWYVSRIYTHAVSKMPIVGTHGEGPAIFRFAKHRRIRLTRALVLEPILDSTQPLSRTPYAFEIISGNGNSHVFRAMNKHQQFRWISALQERIVQAFENSLLKSAELIMTDESIARNRRMEATAVDPLWKEICQQGKDRNLMFTGSHSGKILRWGMDVARYRECCRYIQCMVAQKRFSATRCKSESRTISAVVEIEVLALWDYAADLLEQAMQMAISFHNLESNELSTPSPSESTLPSSIDTLCQYIDFVITGRFHPGKCRYASPSLPPETPPPLPLPTPRARTTSSSSNFSHSSETEQNDLPPADLFDHLLAELQRIAVASDGD